jgi:hypothetical protein
MAENDIKRYIIIYKVFSYKVFPDEISNIICSYIESPTSKIIKDLNIFDDPYECLKINKTYDFKHIHVPRLVNAICRCCDRCRFRLTPEEYIHKDMYELFLKQKMCFECIQDKKLKIYYTSCESFVLLCILLAIIRFDILIALLTYRFYHSIQV